MDMVPDIVKSSQKMSNPIDDQALEREIVSLTKSSAYIDWWV